MPKGSDPFGKKGRVEKMKIFLAGSVSDDIDEKYKKEGEKLVDFIIENKFDVICCADFRGMIGTMYRKMKEFNQAKMILTVPKIYLKYTENIKEKIDIITDTINERTDASIKNADICLFMPGGIGTTYEMLSAIETKRAGEHNKEIIIVNLFGFYNDFITMIDNMNNKKFVKTEDKNVYKIINTVEDAIDYIKKCK